VPSIANSDQPPLRPTVAQHPDLRTCFRSVPFAVAEATFCSCGAGSNEISHTEEELSSPALRYQQRLFVVSMCMQLRSADEEKGRG